jgi:hypothetical protein
MKVDLICEECVCAYDRAVAEGDKAGADHARKNAIRAYKNLHDLGADVTVNFNALRKAVNTKRAQRLAEAG